MATSEDENFNTACFRERSKAQMLLGKILDTVSAAVAAPNSQPICLQDEGLEGESLVGRNVEKRGLLNIDLNVAPPEDADCELTAADGSRDGQEARPPPPADVAPDVSGREVGMFDKRESDFDGIADEGGVEVETKTRKISVDAEAKMVEKNSRKKRWVALLEYAENALVEKEEEEENRNRKRRASQELELGGEPQKGTPTRRKISGQRRQSLVAEWNGENEVAVVRSSRGRAVAMPNKYRDSVLGAVAIAEAELPRRNKSGKSATVFSTKRKSR